MVGFAPQAVEDSFVAQQRENDRLRGLAAERDAMERRVMALAGSANEDWRRQSAHDRPRSSKAAEAEAEAELTTLNLDRHLQQQQQRGGRGEPGQELGLSEGTEEALASIASVITDQRVAIKKLEAAARQRDRAAWSS